MGFREIAERIPYPQGATERYKRLDALERLLENRLYKHLPYAFDQEDDGREYIPLRNRRPSIQFNSATIIVDQLTGLLWGDEQPPRIVMREDDDETEHDDTQERAIAKIRQRLNLDQIMARVFRRGNVGSVGISVRGLEDGRPVIRIIKGKNAKPVYDDRNPLDLVGVVQVYPTTPDALIGRGYSDIDPDEKFYWMRIEYDAQQETWYKPLSDTDYQRLGQVVGGVKVTWELDKEYPHDFGVVPIVWIRNLDEENEDEDDPDGPCTFGQVVDNIVELDYMLSQIARGYKYSADPMLAINQGELVSAGLRPVGENVAQVIGPGGQIVKSPTNVLTLGEGGSAQMVEITGQGLAHSAEFAKLIREWTLEVMSANKADSENTKGVMSGRALDILHRALRLLKNRQRVAYGNKGLIPLVKLILIGIETGELVVPGVESIPSDTLMWLEWPTEDIPDEQQLLALAQAAQTFAGGSASNPVATLPIDEIVRLLCDRVGSSNANEIIKKLEAQRVQRQQEAQEQTDADHARQVQLVQAKPTPAEPVRQGAKSK